MSNTATAVMMLPIGLSMIKMAHASSQDDFAKAVLLAIAYSASIGGIATLIGTPPNALLAAYLSKSYQIQITFADWMLLGVPLALVMLGFCWVWLCKIHFKLPATSSGQHNFKQEWSGSYQLDQPAMAGQMDRFATQRHHDCVGGCDFVICTTRRATTTLTGVERQPAAAMGRIIAVWGWPEHGRTNSKNRRL
jgi:hypothetical protein